MVLICHIDIGLVHDTIPMVIVLDTYNPHKGKITWVTINTLDNAHIAVIGWLRALARLLVKLMVAGQSRTWLAVPQDPLRSRSLISQQLMKLYIRTRAAVAKTRRAVAAAHNMGADEGETIC